MEPNTTSLPELRARIDQAVAALSGTWRSPSEGRITLVFGSKAARQAVLRDLKHRLPAGALVSFLNSGGLFLSLMEQVVPAGAKMDVWDPAESLRSLAAAYAGIGKRLILVCDDVERAAPHDLGYLCRGVNATVIDAYDGKPGILLILLGTSAGAAHRRIYEAWPDAEMGTQSHYLD